MGEINRESVFKQIVERYLDTNTVYAVIDKDGDLLIRTILDMQCSVFTYVVPEACGFYIRCLYGLKADHGRANLVEKINEINCTLREGAMILRDDGEIQFRTFIPDIDATPSTIMRCVKIGVVTFTENIQDIIECMKTYDDISNSDFEIVDTEVVQ